MPGAGPLIFLQDRKNIFHGADRYYQGRARHPDEKHPFQNSSQYGHDCIDHASILDCLAGLRQKGFFSARRRNRIKEATG